LRLLGELPPGRRERSFARYVQQPSRKFPQPLVYRMPVLPHQDHAAGIVEGHHSDRTDVTDQVALRIAAIGHTHRVGDNLEDPTGKAVTAVQHPVTEVLPGRFRH
jgi:hypothetical protein